MIDIRVQRPQQKRDVAPELAGACLRVCTERAITVGLRGKQSVSIKNVVACRTMSRDRPVRSTAIVSASSSPAAMRSGVQHAIR